MNLTFQVSYVAERQGSLVSRFVELMWPDGTIMCIYIYIYLGIYIYIYILYIKVCGVCIFWIIYWMIA